MQIKVTGVKAKLPEFKLIMRLYKKERNQTYLCDTR